MPIYDELWARDDKLTSPGGSALNSARAQKFANSNGTVAYFGCIGSDAKGQALTEAVTAAGIEGKFEVTQEDSTGVCACVVVGKERTLCANIGAAKKFTMDYFNANIDVLNRARFFYTTGFFVDSNFEAVKALCNYATTNDKPLGFNLSALFVI